MYDKTKYLKQQAKQDLQHIREYCSSEHSEQSRYDKFDHYEKKWERYLNKSDTEAQVKYCTEVLNTLHFLR